MKNLITPEILHTEIPLQSMMGMEIRRKYFPDTIRFHNPGLRRHRTSEINCHQIQEFVSISLTGTHCALDCNIVGPMCFVE